MNTKTRYFAIVSLLVVVVGLGTGLVAYYTGFQGGGFFGSSGPDELRFLPNTVSVVGYVEVREIMASDLRQRLRRAMSSDAQENGRREFQELTGINFETDIERVVAGFDAAQGAASTNTSGLVLARGLFDPTKIEALMREHGAQVQDYKGQRLIVADHFGNGDVTFDRFGRGAESSSVALAFIEPGLVAFGGTTLVQHAIDLHVAGGASAATNDELVAHVRALREIGRAHV